MYISIPNKKKKKILFIRLNILYKKLIFQIISKLFKVLCQQILDQFMIQNYYLKN